MKASALRATLASGLVVATGCGAVAPLDLRATGPRHHHLREVDVAPAADGTVRFFAVGDAGEPAPNAPFQVGPEAHAVARAVATTCLARGGCQLGLMLGDNVYRRGLDEGDREDEARLADLIAAYASTAPIYFALGNHDWGPGLIPYLAPPTTARAERELGALARLGARGRAHFFEFEAGPVGLFAWDTNYLVQRCSDLEDPPRCDLQGAEALGAVGRSRRPFRVVFGHHPLRSNGEHGDAGQYRDEGFLLYPGEGLRTLFEAHVIGQADLYLAGHDHNLQVFTPDDLRGTAAVVSGSGSKTTALRPADARAEDAAFEARALGFVLVEADRTRMSLEVFTVPAPPRANARAAAPLRSAAFCKVRSGHWQRSPLEGPSACDAGGGR